MSLRAVFLAICVGFTNAGHDSQSMNCPVNFEWKWSSTTYNYDCFACQMGYERSQWSSYCYGCGYGQGSQDGSGCRDCDYNGYTSYGTRPSGPYSPGDAYSGDSRDGCYPCKTGKSWLQKGTSYCSNWPNGNYRNGCGYDSLASGADCSNCGPGYWGQCVSSTTSCTVETDPTATASTTNCIPCALGKYKALPGNEKIDEASTIATCLNCAPGYYADSVGTGKCTACPQGKLAACGTPTGSEGCTTACDCKTCTGGTYADLALGACVNCPGGKYSDGTGICKFCPPGTTSPPGSETCEVCPDGTHSIKNRTECMECPDSEGINCLSGIVTFPNGWWTSLALGDPESQRFNGDTRVFKNHTKKGVNCNTTTQLGCQPDDFHDRIDNETIIQQCFIKDSCIGGHNITCKVGYTGPLCASCDAPAYVMVGGQCRACEGDANPDNFYVLVGAFMGVLGAIFLLIAILGPYCYFKKSRRVEDEVTDSRLQDNKTEAANDKAKMKAKTKILTGAVGEQVSTNDNLSSGQEAPNAPAPRAPSLKKTKTVKMEGTQTNFQVFIGVLKWMKSEKIKIAFSFFQVLNVFESNFSIPWPHDVAAFLSAIKVLNLSFAEAFKLGCYASNGNFYTTFYIMMFTPIMLTAFIACVCTFGLCYAKCRKKADKMNWIALCCRFWGLMVFAIFPSLNSVLFQVFDSVKVDDHWFLRRDMTINCDADNQERTNMLMLACFCVLLYPIGILSMFGLILIRFRNYMASMYIVHNEDGAPLFRGPSMDPKSDLHARMPHNTVVRAIGKNRMTVTSVHGEEWIQFLWKADWDGDGDEEEVKVWTQLSDNRSNQLYIKSNAWFFLTDAFGWLYAAYEGQFYFWELIEFGRKLLLSAAIIFCYPGSPLQIIIGLLIMVCFLWALSTFKPYEDDSDDTAQGLSFFALTVTLLCGLAFRIQQETAASNDPNNRMKNLILTVIIIAMNSFLALSALGIVVINVLPLVRAKMKKKETGVIAKLDPSASEPTTVMIDLDKHPFQVQYNGEWYNVKWLADFPEDAPQTGMYGPLEITRVNHFRRGQVWLSDNSCFENPSDQMSAKVIDERKQSLSQTKSNQVAPDGDEGQRDVEQVVAL